MPKRSAQAQIERYARKVKRLEDNEKRRRRIVSPIDSSSSDEEGMEATEHAVTVDNESMPPEPLPVTSDIQDEGLECTDIQEQEEAATNLASDLDPELLAALGESTSESPDYGDNIHDNLVKLWLPLLKKGMPKENKDKLLKDYLIPDNCRLLQAPKLNAEISAAVPDMVRNRDKTLTASQQQLGSGITAINKGIDLLLKSDNKIQAIKYLSNGCRLLCDSHYSATQSRVKLITPSLDKTFLHMISESERDDSLFGSTLSDKIKAAKAIEKQGLSIKKPAKPQKPTALQSSTRPSSRPGKLASAFSVPGEQGGARELQETADDIIRSSPPLHGFSSTASTSCGPGQTPCFGSKSPLAQILSYVRENVKGRRTTLARTKFPPGTHSLTFPVDDQTKEPTVSVTGTKPSVTVTGPNGTKTDTETLDKKDQYTIVKLLDPKRGNYTVKVASPSKTSVVVSARTEIKFQHGFSTFKPTSINDTTTRPLPDVKSHISIKLTDGNVDLKSIKILDKDDQLLKELPLAVLDEKEKLFSTGPEDLPSTMFKISIVAYDPESKTNITRMGPLIAQQPPTSVRAAENIAPTVTISGEPTLIAEWNIPLQLKCKVNGYPQPDIVWFNRDSGVKIPASVSTVELPSDFISILDIKRVLTTTNYECKATNLFGSDSKIIEVKTTAIPHVTVLRAPKDTYIKYLGKGEIHCEVDAYPPVNITWYKDRRPLLKNGNLEFSDDNSVIKIKSMKLSDDGSYTCEIRNVITRKILTAIVTITNVEAPKINKTTTALTIETGSDAVIHCNVIKGRPKPTVTWFYDDGTSGESKPMDHWKDKETVTITNAYKKDAGVYSCIAKNMMGKAYHETELTVEYPPTIKRDLETFRVAKGASVFMSCFVEGMPDPVVTWYRNNVALTKADNIHIYRDHSIRLTAGVDDHGTYTCKARNKLGTTSRVINLDVFDQVTIDIPKQSRLDVRVGTTLNLPCNAKGYPTPKTEWMYYSFNSSLPSKPMLKSLGSSSLKLRNMQLGDDGYYTCTANHFGGQTNITYEIHVVAPPLIENIYLDKEFKVVEGDLVLIIKCKASGNPTPVIKWLKNGYWTDTEYKGDDFTIENGTFIMKNISENAEGVYICEAKNSLGFNREVYEVKVLKSPQPGHPTSTVVIAEGSSSLINCDVPHTKIDLLRWYKNGKMIHTGELKITNAKVHDSGLYTCRVSSFTKSNSGNTLVKVGFKPKFIRDEEEIIEYVANTPYVLGCEANGEPQPMYTWWHNGEIMNTTDNYHYLEMEPGTQGQYVCEARNEFGNTVRSFNIISKDCLIDIKKQPSKLQPLILSSKLHWPDYEVKNGYISIPKGEYVVLFCQNELKAIPKPYTVAFCEGGSKLKIHGKSYDYSDIECTEKITHFIEHTGESCFTGNTELVQVVFKVLSETVEAYEVCVDIENNRPLYTNLRMSNSIADTDYLVTKWSDEDEIDLNLNDAYNCDLQTKTISSILGRWFHRDDGCCFGKKQLVSPKDLMPGVSQRTAYSHLNVVPHWSSCNVETNNWNEVEQRVRTLAKATYSELLVSTGVAGDLSLPDTSRSAQKIIIADKENYQQIVPKYLWKVVQEPATKSSLVIIQVNVPDLLPSEAAAYVRCRDICNSTKWMKGSTWYDVTKGFTFCCSLDEFEDKFGYRGIFNPYNHILNDVSFIPENSLT